MTSPGVTSPVQPLPDGSFPVSGVMRPRLRMVE